MSYEAFVPCGCYEAGLCSVPPVPVEVGEDGEVVPVDGSDEEHWLAVEEWQETACPHPQMCLAKNLLANNFWWGRFMTAVDLVGGEEDLDTLLAVLPGYNEGFAPRELCATMLEELDRFLASTVRWDVPAVRDARTGRVLYMEGMSMWAGRLAAVLTRDGHVEVSDRKGAVRLRSRYLTQRVAQRDADGSPIRVELRDLDTRRSVRGRLVIRGDGPDGSPPAELLVGLQEQGPRDYEDIAGRLRGLLEVALVHGRPVRWTWSRRDRHLDAA